MFYFKARGLTLKRINLIVILGCHVAKFVVQNEFPLKPHTANNWKCVNLSSMEDSRSKNMYSKASKEEAEEIVKVTADK
jgi:hypothetical protein